jgi:Leucine-rich repeat (LRR) protein
MSTNKITVLPHITCANLYKLILDENEISKSELKSHQNLKELSLKKNKLTSCEGIERLYNLQTLILEENEIATLKGLSVLPKLMTLNLKTNKLDKLDNFPRLEVIEDL